ncbi:sulfite exporter TauE/SafE family protein [Rhizobium sp. VS19-DR104.2]|uniref:sulfite exporter TauE/SafE family protein n=1 Tax=unclassified Rhizobium TaxID=2613769 RepID=UPI001C5A6E7D|nr:MULTISPECIES: sulfite exporter TauE/SafE family protein [unclassified Rhizobium]MBZ5762480.1 sulfite exporter TauE/SafE family protein [Rhizobium sp. VS19-DR96]MBZ5768505.1 sulfite exporter TauE/SafE family protein [Rhizobium sp. VS19-DR129.2]MBZ5776023.1 sulfite exporter TauE/SafE family protein [Rhizobium sp. VS19-DRK62.2]MBZ5787205.1 sulfite exporter TauE/SafE family protein [Rhizobium sp. VS19-DR121]MBZ5804558.1 sulfite exporter TauE/SafE family protein [Rhizobium sp. VS19-DR181]
METVTNLVLANLSGKQFLFLLASALVAGLARGFSGFGTALIFMPLASAVIGPQSAAPLLLIIDAVTAVGLIPDAWRRSDRRGVWTMAVGAAMGVPLGTAMLTMIDPLAVWWIIVLVVVLLLILLVSGWRYHGRPSAPLTIGVGAVSGMFTGAAQIGGPPVVVYWLGGSIPSAIVRANIVLYFAISTVLTGASYVIGGLITELVVVFALTTGPLYGSGLYLGSQLFGRASETVFRWICYGLISAAAVFSLPVLDQILR